MSYPNLLYRAFTDLCYARQFADAGRFRIGRLDWYRNIENAARGDAEEGLGHYIDTDGISEYFKLGNPIYILSCSTEDVDLVFLKRKMGPFIIRINDPLQLAYDIAAYLKEQEIKFFGEVRYRAVGYTKGAVINTAHNAMERAELSIAQKHPHFSEEKEQRLYAIVNTHCPTPLLTSHLEINLGRRLPYVEILHGA